MEYKRLGKSGLKLSTLSFGSWVSFSKQMDIDAAKACMTLAYDAGVNFFDNAEAYEGGASEELMGQVLQEAGWSRDSYCVSSKVFWGGRKPTQRGLSRKHVHDACHAALKRLRVDYLDLYFCHRPDVDTPIEETVRAMHDLIQQGKVLYWGTSEWNAQQITEAHMAAQKYNLTPPTMEQPEYSMLVREKVDGDYLPLYDTVGLGTTIWSPLRSGMLTGKYNNGIPENSRINLPGYEWLKERYESEVGQAELAKTRKLEVLAKECGISLTHMALAWCLKNPNVSTVILGASRPEQVTENLKALDAVPVLTDEVMVKIEDILQNKPAGPQRF